MNSRRSDLIWRALADRTRRSMLDLLSEKPRTTGELAKAFKTVSRFAVMKQLKVLEEAGLIIVVREGRLRWNHLNPVPLREVFRKWVGRYETLWADALLDLREQAESESEGTSRPEKPDAKGDRS